MKTAIEYRTRWMVQDDLEEVCRIEADAFAHPWGPKEFERALAPRDTIGRVAVDEDQEIVGFSVYILGDGRLDLVNVAVAEHARRQGVGRLLIQDLIDRLRDDRPRLYAGVWERNLQAQLWLRACGLRAVAIVKGHYGSKVKDDAILFTRTRDGE